MIILHDLVEAEAKDISALDVLRNPEIKLEKIENEKRAIENLRSMLHSTNGQEIYQLFYEFENKETYESKVANALDKLEVQLQHNHGDFSTWEEIEYDMTYMMDKHVQFDSTGNSSSVELVAPFSPSPKGHRLSISLAICRDYVPIGKVEPESVGQRIDVYAASVEPVPGCPGRTYFPEPHFAHHSFGPKSRYHLSYQ